MGDQQDQRRTTQQRSESSIREINAKITVNEEDLHGLIAKLQQHVMEDFLAKLATTKESVVSLPVTPPTPTTTGVEKPNGGLNLPEVERLKAADLRTALLLGKVPETAGLLIDTKTTAKLLNLSQSTLYRLDDEQAIPQPVRIGSTMVRYRLAEILAWIDAGCPPRRVWKYPENSDQKTRR